MPAEAEENLEGDEGHVYIGDLHWWTTDADLEEECSRFGRIRDVKFFEDTSNGKSKGPQKSCLRSKRQLLPARQNSMGAARPLSEQTPTHLLLTLCHHRWVCAAPGTFSMARSVW